MRNECTPGFRVFSFPFLFFFSLVVVECTPGGFPRCFFPINVVSYLFLISFVFCLCYGYDNMELGEEFEEREVLGRAIEGARGKGQGAMAGRLTEGDEWMTWMGMTV